jgi:hypothetical protein
MRNFYNPMRKGGEKHYYIHDLKEDVQTDRRRYGRDLSRYNNVTPPSEEELDRSMSFQSDSQKRSPDRGNRAEIYLGEFGNVLIKSPGLKTPTTPPEISDIRLDWQHVRNL